MASALKEQWLGVPLRGGSVHPKQGGEPTIKHVPNLKEKDPSNRSVRSWGNVAGSLGPNGQSSKSDLGTNQLKNVWLVLRSV